MTDVVGKVCPSLPNTLGDWVGRWTVTSRVKVGLKVKGTLPP